MKRSLLSGGIVCAVILSAPAVTGAATRIRSPYGEAGEVVQDIAFTDGDGEPLGTPIVAVAGAYPGMPPVESVATISNLGNVPIGYDFFVTVTAANEEGSLADVIHVTLRRTTDGQVVFRGRLRDLSVRGAGPISAGDSDSYIVTTRWPEQGRARNNRLQGLTLGFGFHARSYEVD